MGEVRGSARKAAMLVMMVTVPTLFHYCDAATPPPAGTVTWTIPPKVSWAPPGKLFKVNDQIATASPGVPTKSATVKLAKGSNLFVCTIASHCSLGMKVTINAK